MERLLPKEPSEPSNQDRHREQRKRKRNAKVGVHSEDEMDTDMSIEPYIREQSYLREQMARHLREPSNPRSHFPWDEYERTHTGFNVLQLSLNEPSLYSKTTIPIYLGHTADIYSINPRFYGNAEKNCINYKVYLSSDISSDEDSSGHQVILRTKDYRLSAESEDEKNGTDIIMCFTSRYTGVIWFNMHIKEKSFEINSIVNNLRSIHEYSTEYYGKHLLFELLWDPERYEVSITPNAVKLTIIISDNLRFTFDIQIIEDKMQIIKQLYTPTGDITELSVITTYRKVLSQE